MQEFTWQDRARLTLHRLWRAAVLAPTGPTISRVTFPRRIGKGTPDRQLLFRSGDQSLRVGKIQIRISRTSDRAVGG